MGTKTVWNGELTSDSFDWDDISQEKEVAKRVIDIIKANVSVGVKAWLDSLEIFFFLKEETGDVEICTFVEDYDGTSGTLDEHLEYIGATTAGPEPARKLAALLQKHADRLIKEADDWERGVEGV